MSTEPKRRVEAEEFLLCDANGSIRAALAITTDGPGFLFYDQSGTIRTRFLLEKDGVPGLTLIDEEGRQRVKLGIAADASTVELFDVDGTTSLSRTVLRSEHLIRIADLEASLAGEIAARTHLEQTLESEKKRYKAFTATQSQLVWITNATGEVIEDIPMWRSFTGQSAEEAKGLGWVQAIHPDDRNRVQEVLIEIREKPSLYETECRVRRQDNGYCTFSVRAVPVLRDDETVAEWVLTAIDVSERKRAEEALRASKERVNALTACSAQLQETIKTAEAARTSERQRQEEALRASEERVSALTASSAQLQEALRASEATVRGERQRLEAERRAGEERLMSVSAAKTKLEESLRVAAEGHAAERKEWQQGMEAREKRYHYLAGAVAQLVWTTNVAGELIEALPAWSAFTGQSPEEAKGVGWMSAIHPGDRECVQEVLRQAREARSPYRTEYRLRRNDGEYRIFAVRGVPVVEDEVAIREWDFAATDITEDKEAATLLTASEKKYRQIVEAAPEGIWMIDPDNRITFANPRLAEMLGWSEEEMLGRTLLDFLDEEGRQTTVENLACCRRGVAVQYDLKIRNKEGVELQTRASTRPLFDAGGQYSGSLALMIDLTEQNRLAGQRQHAEKLQSLGHLAGGVAHGINNLLTVINGFSEFLLTKVPQNDPMHESLRQITKAGERAAEVITPLVAFSQGQILQAKALDLNEVVAEFEKAQRGQLGDNIRLATVLGPSLGTVKGDPKQLQQVLMNLVTNAREAVGSVGSLVIETRNVDLDASYAAQNPGVEPGPFVELTVSDTGAGMSEETQAHLFEPFFTTKSQGAGLGLATAYGIIKQSGGSIRVESQLGKGSTFHVFLPRIGEPVPVPEEAKPEITTLSGTETILVVEDQEAVRSLAQVVLKSFGYRVLVAENGWEALHCSDRHIGPIHLLLTDVMMPGMSGQELAERFRPLRPEMQVVFMSGYIEHGSVPPALPDTKTGFLAKPFSPEALATKVREVLGPPRSTGRVLVIDDDAVGIRGFLRMVLGSVGYEVLEASDGTQGAQQLDAGSFDLIFVDLEKPHQGLVEKIRALQKRAPEVKVIAITGSHGEEALRAAEQLGAQGTLLKPIRADQLLESVRQRTND